MGEMRCPSCGWENDASARMCGGCGRPLRPSAAGPAGAPYSGGRVEPRGPSGAYRQGMGGRAGYSDTEVTDPDMPTVRDYPAPQRYTPPVAAYPARRIAPQPIPMRRRRSASSAGLVALVALALLALLGVGAWSAAIRPSLHQQVDTVLRTQMLSMVATVNSVPAIQSTTVSMTGDQATASLQAGIPSGVPLQNVQVTFQGGYTVVSFTTYSLNGTVSTQLVTTNGRLAATNSTVDGPVGLVESGGELQDTLNAALGTLRHDVTIKQVTEQNNVLTVAVKGAV